MIINQANMDALFKTYSKRFSDAQQAAAARAYPNQLTAEDIALLLPVQGAATQHSWLDQIKGIHEWAGDRVINNLKLQALRACPTAHTVITSTTNTVVLRVKPGGGITADPAWDMIYGRILCEARSLFTSDGPVLWLMPGAGLSNGMDIVKFSGSAWSGQVYSAPHWDDETWWTLAAADCATDGTAVTSTRMPFAGVNYLEGVSSANYPLSGQFGCGPDASGVSGDWPCGNGWTQAGLGTNVYKLGCEIIRTNRVAAYNQVMKTNDLNDARGILTNLVRSVYVCPVGSMQYSNCTLYAGISVQTGGAGYTNDTSQRTWDFDAFEASCLDIPETLATNCAPSNPGDICTVSYACDRWDENMWTPGNPNGYSASWGGRWQFTGEYRSLVYKGCKLPYPCDFAAASGYVSRVTVYLVAEAASQAGQNRLFTCTDYNGGTMTLEESKHLSPTNYAGVTFGICDHLCPIKAPPSEFARNSGTWDTLPPGSLTTLPPKSLKLSLVGTWEGSALTGRPSFDLGVRHPEIPADTAQSYHGILTRPNDYKFDEMAESVFSTCVHVSHFVVVVDWDWRHLNPDHPFSPETYKPEWLSTNAVP